MIVRSEKIMKVPQELTNDVHQIALKLNGLTVFESCVYMESKAGTLFLEDHLLLFVLNGTYTFVLGTKYILYAKMKWFYCKNRLSLNMRNLARMIRKTVYIT